MKSIYDIEEYCLYLNAAKFQNTPFEKKFRELRNKIKKSKNKKKTKHIRKLINEYHVMKSVRLSLMYGPTTALKTSTKPSKMPIK